MLLNRNQLSLDGGIEAGNSIDLPNPSLENARPNFLPAPFFLLFSLFLTSSSLQTSISNPVFLVGLVGQATLPLRSAYYGREEKGGGRNNG